MIPAKMIAGLPSPASETLRWAAKVIGAGERIVPWGYKSDNTVDGGAPWQMIVYKDGTLHDLFVVIGQGSDGTDVYTVFKNDVATLLTCTIIGNTGFATAQDIVNNVSVVRGDRIALNHSLSGGASGTRFLDAMLSLTPT